MSLKRPPVSVVIPAHNEGASIHEVVEGIARSYPDFEVIVIDDHSTDGTAERARRAGARVIQHPYNMGNGAAVKTGIRQARGDVVVLMDGDGQHESDMIQGLLEHMETYDMVVGARAKGSAGSLHRRVANYCYNRLATYVTRFPVADLTSGLRAIRTSLARRYLYLLPNGFSYPSTLTLSLLRSGRSVRYVPFIVRKRKGESKIRILSDGSRFLLIILRIALFYSPLRIFIPVSLTLFVASLGWYAYTFLTQHRFTNMGVLLFLSGLTIFMLGLVSEQISLLRMDRTENLVSNDERTTRTPDESAET